MKNCIGMLIDFDIRRNCIVFTLDSEYDGATGLVPLDDYSISLPAVESLMSIYEMYELSPFEYDANDNSYKCKFVDSKIFKAKKASKLMTDKNKKYERYNQAYDKTLKEGNKPYKHKEPVISAKSTSPVISNEDDTPDKSSPLTTNLASLINNAMQKN